MFTPLKHFHIWLTNLKKINLVQSFNLKILLIILYLIKSKIFFIHLFIYFFMTGNEKNAMPHLQLLNGGRGIIYSSF